MMSKNMYINTRHYNLKVACKFFHWGQYGLTKTSNFGVLGDFGGEDEELHKKCEYEGTSLRQTASFEPLTVQIGSAV